MNNIAIEIDSETSRIRAALVNSGKFTFSEAEKKLSESELLLRIGRDSAGSPAGQAALLTAVLTAVRCFGKVAVQGELDQPLLVTVPLRAKSLSEAATLLGAHHVPSTCSGRTVLLGAESEPSKGWSVKAWWDGWCAGVVPGAKPIYGGRSDCVLAGVAAAGLAVGQAFWAEQGDVRAGRIPHHLSLWDPELGELCIGDPGPLWKEVYLPTALWLVGLGNLGQAFLWSLSLLPYRRPEDVILFFQDDDRIRKENWGTSILVQRGKYGDLKTRIAEEWAANRKFEVRRVDRRLDQTLSRSAAEPGILIAGLDNMAARRLLSGRGFKFIIDAGLGATARDYANFRINIFDPTTSTEDHFHGVEDNVEDRSRGLLELPAYQEQVRSLADNGCGAAMLARRSVAVPFVSAVVGALSVTQTIRIASGQAYCSGLTGDVRDLRSLRTGLSRQPGRLTIANVSADETVS